MTVSNTTSRNQYTATSGQTVFPYTFEIFDKGDVVVLKNSTALSEGTNYTVSGVGNDNGGNITLTVGATAGDILTIYRDMAYQRTTDYQTSGDFLAQEVNDDFDRLWLAMQQGEETHDRALVKPITDPASIDMTLPSSADRANSVLGFSATGAPIVGPSTTDVDTLVNIAADIATLADIEDGTVATDAISDTAAIASNVTTVAGISSSVVTVSGNTTNINTVAGISADVTAVAGVASDVDALGAVASDIPPLAAITSDITIAADNVADITNFADVYQGGKATDPTLRNDGSALQAGDLYFNTTNDELRVYSGSIWQAGTAGTVSVQNFTGDGSDTTFVLASAPSGENNTQIYIDGVYQQKNTYSLAGSTITFSEAPPNLADIEVVTISTLALGQTDSSLTLYTPAGTGAVQTTVQTKLRETVSVKDFGAVGDGVTDDTAAIQAAIDSGAKFIRIPEGTYNTTSPIVINSALTLQGDEFNTTVIRKSTATGGTGSNTARSGGYTDNWTGDDVIQIRHTDNAYTFNVSIKDITIKKQTYASGSTAIFAPRTAKCNYENILVAFCDHGFKTYDTFMTSFHRFEALACQYGISFLDDGSGIGAGTSCHFENCYINFSNSTVNPTAGYNLYGLSYSALTACGCDNGTRTDSGVPNQYLLNVCEGITLNSCGAENGSANVLKVIGGSAIVNSFRATGFTGVTSGTSAVVWAETGTELTLNNCRFEAITSAGATSNWIIQTGANVVEINPQGSPSGGNSFVSYGGGSTYSKLALGTLTSKNSTTTTTFENSNGSQDGLTLAPSSSGTITASTSNDELSYRKFGGVVHMFGIITVSAVSSPTGTSITLSGLPFTSANLPNNSGRVGTTVSVNQGGTWSVVPASISEGSTTMTIYIDASTVTTSTQFWFDFNYPV